MTLSWAEYNQMTVQERIEHARKQAAPSSEAKEEPAKTQPARVYFDGSRDSAIDRTRSMGLRIVAVRAQALKARDEASAVGDHGLAAQCMTQADESTSMLDDYGRALVDAGGVDDEPSLTESSLGQATLKRRAYHAVLDRLPDMARHAERVQALREELIAVRDATEDKDIAEACSAQLGRVEDLVTRYERGVLPANASEVLADCSALRLPPATAARIVQSRCSGFEASHRLRFAASARDLLVRAGEPVESYADHFGLSVREATMGLLRTTITNKKAAESDLLEIDATLPGEQYDQVRLPPGERTNPKSALQAQAIAHWRNHSK